MALLGGCGLSTEEMEGPVPAQLMPVCSALCLSACVSSPSYLVKYAEMFAIEFIG